jgi:hypothetical protein
MLIPMRWLAPPAALIITAIAVVSYRDYARAPSVPVDYVSHQLCSAAFVAGLDPDQFYREAVAPMIVPAGFLMHYNIDRAGRTVTASLAGLVRSRAVLRGAFGCQVDHGRKLPPVVAATTPEAAPLLPPIAGPDIVAPRDPALKTALDCAFAEPEEAPHRYGPQCTAPGRSRHAA